MTMGLQGISGMLESIACIVNPSHLEPFDVLAVDLIESGIAHTVRATSIHLPISIPTFQAPPPPPPPAVEPPRPPGSVRKTINSGSGRRHINVRRLTRSRNLRGRNDRSEKVGNRGQMFPISRRIVVLFGEKSGKYGPILPLSQEINFCRAGSQLRKVCQGVMLVLRGEQLCGPVRYDACELPQNLVIGPPQLSGNMEGVVRGLHNMKRRPISQLLADGPQQCQICQPVTSSLQEEHWHLDLGQMVGPSDIRSSWSMQGKSKKDQPLDRGQTGLGCQRRHASAHGFPPCQKLEFRGRFRGGGNRRLNCFQ